MKLLQQLLTNPIRRFARRGAGGAATTARLGGGAGERHYAQCGLASARCGWAFVLAVCGMLMSGAALGGVGEFELNTAAGTYNWVGGSTRGTSADAWWMYTKNSSGTYEASYPKLDPTNNCSVYLNLRGTVAGNRILKLPTTNDNAPSIRYMVLYQNGYLLTLTNGWLNFSSIQSYRQIWLKDSARADIIDAHLYFNGKEENEFLVGINSVLTFDNCDFSGVSSYAKPSFNFCQPTFSQAAPTTVNLRNSSLAFNEIFSQTNSSCSSTRNMQIANSTISFANIRYQEDTTQTFCDKIAWDVKLGAKNVSGSTTPAINISQTYIATSGSELAIDASAKGAGTYSILQAGTWTTQSNLKLTTLKLPDGNTVDFADATAASGVSGVMGAWQYAISAATNNTAMTLTLTPYDNPIPGHADWGYVITNLTGTLGKETAYVFTNTTATMNWTVPDGVSCIRYLVVGGGGGGGSTYGGGGGAGQVVTATDISVSPGDDVTVTVGAGGGGGYRNGASSTIDSAGTNGVSSRLVIGTSLDVPSLGGGGGAGNREAARSGGASGGGGNGCTIGTYKKAGTASTGCGNNGGAGCFDTSSTKIRSGGGGGGAGAVGVTATTTVTGDGGSGLSSDITGTSVYYAGGGGGGGQINSSTGVCGGTGGAGGGGNGGGTTTTALPTAGAANSGGGGGGGNWTTISSQSAYNSGSCNGAAGGSGVVIIRTIAMAARYSTDGGSKWTYTSTVDAALAAATSQTADMIIEVLADGDFLTSNEQFSGATCNITIRSPSGEGPYTITRTATSSDKNWLVPAGKTVTVSNLVVNAGSSTVTGLYKVGSTGGDGAKLYLGPGGVLTSDKNSGAGYAAIVFGELHIDGGVICGWNISTDPVIYPKEGSVTYITAGGISNCVQTSGSGNYPIVFGGAGITSENATLLYMSGGFIKDNRISTSSDTSNGIIGFSSTQPYVSISGGEISGNVSTMDSKGAIYKAKVLLSGNPVITGNTSAGAAKNVYHGTDGTTCTITMSGSLTAGANVGVYSESAYTRGETFGSLASSGLTGAEYIHNDRNAKLFGGTSGTSLIWMSAGATVTIDATDGVVGSESISLTVPYSWMNTYGLAADDVEGKEKFGANGYPYWKSYVHGLAPNATGSRLWSDFVQNASAETQSLTLRWPDTPPTVAGLKRLYGVFGSTSPTSGFAPVDGVATNDTGSFEIPLSDVESVRYYRVKTLYRQTDSQAVVYTWKGASGGAWTDADNWEPDVTPCFGYPDSLLSQAVFTNNAVVDAQGAYVTVTNITLKKGSVTLKDLNLTTHGEPTAKCGILVPANGTLILDGGRLTLNANIPGSGATRMSLYSNATLEYRNGAQFDGGWAVSVWGESNDKLVLRDGDYTQQWRYGNDTTGFVVEVTNATVNLTLTYQNTSIDTLKILEGQINCVDKDSKNEFIVSNELDFTLPANGYTTETAPLKRTGGAITITNETVQVVVDATACTTPGTYPLIVANELTATPHVSLDTTASKFASGCSGTLSTGTTDGYQVLNLTISRKNEE